MTKNIRLNDLQLVLLSSAAARDNGSLMPLPASCTQDHVRIGKALAALLRRALIEELPVTDRSLCWREQDQDMIGLSITDGGRTAIGAGLEESAANAVANADAGSDGTGRVGGQASDDAKVVGSKEPAATRTHTETTLPASATPRAGSKIAAVVALLERPEGAALDELVAATGWLPHTTRAALTGLRKKGHTLTSEKSGEVRRYRIVGAAG